RGGGARRARRSRDVDGGGRRVVRQGSSGGGFLQARAARAALSARPDRPLPSRPPADLLRRRAPCPPRIGLGPCARTANIAWKAGRDASQSSTEALGPFRTKMSRSAYGFRPGQLAQCGIAKCLFHEGGTD